MELPKQINYISERVPNNLRVRLFMGNCVSVSTALFFINGVEA